MVGVRLAAADEQLHQLLRLVRQNTVAGHASANPCQESTMGLWTIVIESLSIQLSRTFIHLPSLSVIDDSLVSLAMKIDEPGRHDAPGHRQDSPPSKGLLGNSALATANSDMPDSVEPALRVNLPIATSY